MSIKRARHCSFLNSVTMYHFEIGAITLFIIQIFYCGKTVGRNLERYAGKETGRQQTVFILLAKI